MDHLAGQADLACQSTMSTGLVLRTWTGMLTSLCQREDPRLHPQPIATLNASNYTYSAHRKEHNRIAGGKPERRRTWICQHQK